MSKLVVALFGNPRVFSINSKDVRFIVRYRLDDVDLNVGIKKLVLLNETILEQYAIEWAVTYGVQYQVFHVDNVSEGKRARYLALLRLMERKPELALMFNMDKDDIIHNMLANRNIGKIPVNVNRLKTISMVDVQDALELSNGL